MMGIEPTTLGLLDPRSNQLSYIGLNKTGHQCYMYTPANPHLYIYQGTVYITNTLHILDFI